MLQTSAVNLPLSSALRDAFGTNYFVQRDGGFTGPAGIATSLPKLSLVSNGTETAFTGTTIGQYEDAKREIAIRQDNVAGLNVTRKVYVPAAGYFARVIDFVTNPTADPITIDLVLTANPRGASSALQTPFTSSGDTTVGVNDAWIVADDSNAQDPQYTPSQSNNPPVAFVSGGQGARDAMDAVTWVSNTSGTTYTRTFQSVTVPGGGRVAVMHFVVPHYSRQAAQAAAERLVQLPPEAVGAMTSPEAAEVLNFAIPADLSSPIAPLPAATGRVAGVVYEGDGVTVTPSAKVVLHSTFEPLARDIVVTSSSLGIFDVVATAARPMPLVPMSIVATHSEGGAVAPTVQAGLSADQPVVSVPVPFTGTAIIDIVVRRGIDGSVVPSGQLTAATVQATTFVNDYSRFKSLDAQGRARFTGVPLPADGYVSFQITASHQQGSVLTSFGSVNASPNTVNPVSLSTTGGVVTGVVTLGSGLPAAGLQVRIVDSPNFASFQRTTTTDAVGRYTSTDVPPGRYYVLVTHPTNGSRLEPLTFVAANTVSTVDLTFPKLGTISMTLRRANGAVMGGDALLLQGFTTIRNYTTIPATGASAGSLAFTNLAVGTYTLTVRPGAVDSLSVSRTVTIVNDGEVVANPIVAAPFGRVVGTVKRPNGSVPNTVFNLFHVRAGDTYVAYNKVVDGSGNYSQDYVPAGLPVRIEVRYPEGSCCTERKTTEGGPIVNDGDEIAIDALTPARASIALTVVSGSGAGQVVGVCDRAQHHRVLPERGQHEQRGTVDAVAHRRGTLSYPSDRSDRLAHPRRHFGHGQPAGRCDDDPPHGDARADHGDDHRPRDLGGRDAGSSQWRVRAPRGGRRHGCRHADPHRCLRPVLVRQRRRLDQRGHRARRVERDRRLGQPDWRRTAGRAHHARRGRRMSATSCCRSRR